MSATFVPESDGTMSSYMSAYMSNREMQWMGPAYMLLPGGKDRANVAYGMETLKKSAYLHALYCLGIFRAPDCRIVDEDVQLRAPGFQIRHKMLDGPA